VAAPHRQAYISNNCRYKQTKWSAVTEKNVTIGEVTI